MVNTWRQVRTYSPEWSFESEQTTSPTSTPLPGRASDHVNQYVHSSIVIPRKQPGALQAFVLQGVDGGDERMGGQVANWTNPSKLTFSGLTVESPTIRPEPNAKRHFYVKPPSGNFP